MVDDDLLQPHERNALSSIRHQLGVACYAATIANIAASEVTAFEKREKLAKVLDYEWQRFAKRIAAVCDTDESALARPIDFRLVAGVALATFDDDDDEIEVPTRPSAASTVKGWFARWKQSIGWSSRFGSRRASRWAR